jgi:hypothetical protein
MKPNRVIGLNALKPDNLIANTNNKVTCLPKIVHKVLHKLSPLGRRPGLLRNTLTDFKQGMTNSVATTYRISL